MLQHRLALSAFMLLPLHVLILFSKPHQVVLFCEVSGHLALPTYSLLAQPSAPPSVSVRLSGILFLLPRPLLEFPLNRLHWGTNWVCLKTFFFASAFLTSCWREHPEASIRVGWLQALGAWARAPPRSSRRPAWRPRRGPFQPSLSNESSVEVRREPGAHLLF